MLPGTSSPYWHQTQQALITNASAAPKNVRRRPDRQLREKCRAVLSWIMVQIEDRGPDLGDGEVEIVDDAFNSACYRVTRIQAQGTVKRHTTSEQPLDHAVVQVTGDALPLGHNLLLDKGEGGEAVVDKHRLLNNAPSVGRECSVGLREDLPGIWQHGHLRPPMLVQGGVKATGWGTVICLPTHRGVPLPVEDFIVRRNMAAA